jgi:hypothetical protein
MFFLERAQHASADFRGQGNFLKSNALPLSFLFQLRSERCHGFVLSGRGMTAVPLIVFHTCYASARRGAIFWDAREKVGHGFSRIGTDEFFDHC